MSGNVVVFGLSTALCLTVLFSSCSNPPPEHPTPAMETVTAGWFDMGRSYGDSGEADEMPVHRVYLDDYAIGRFPVTNKQFVDVLNWALEKKLLQTSEGNPYDGGEIFAYGKPLADNMTTGVGSQIRYGIGKFQVLSRTGYEGTEFSMDQHPVQMVTWYGAVVYCNWLSEISGLQPCYGTDVWVWNPMANGYRLPTEAEWERAAAWDGSKHWKYGVSSDEMDVSRANFYGEDYANPLGLSAMPFTSPVHWYNGLNPVKLSDPDIKTVRSTSPAGCFDMAGNTWEWCYDWYGEDYYARSGVANPTGPATGEHRVGRGGSWRYSQNHCRAADRYYNWPDYRSRYQGFRIARSLPPQTK